VNHWREIRLFGADFGHTRKAELMLFDKITLATRRVDFVNIQVSIRARHKKIVFSPNLVNGAYVLEPTRMQFRCGEISALL